MPNIHAPRTKTKKQTAIARRALEKRLALWEAGIDPDTGKKIVSGPRGRKRRKRNGESFRQTGGIHVDIGSDVKGRASIRNPIRGSIRSDAYALCRAALKMAHDSRGSLIAKQAAVSYAQGTITACAKLGALPPADVRLYSEALRDIVKG